MGNYSFFSFVIALMLAITIILLPVVGEEFESVEEFYEGVFDGLFNKTFPMFLMAFMFFGGIAISLGANPRKILGGLFSILFLIGLLYLWIEILGSIEVETTRNVLRIVQYF